MANNYLEDAQSDALEAMDYLEEQIIEEAREGAASKHITDHDDSYHHETHIDREYTLTEAAALLDQLSRWEETDSGLWEGQEPRKAIGTQAAYTYGNAVANFFGERIGELNDFLSGTDDEDKREAMARLWILLVGRHDAQEPEKSHESAMAAAALEGLEADDTIPAGIFCDWLEDQGETTICAAETIRRLCETFTAESAEEEEEAEAD